MNNNSPGYQKLREVMIKLFGFDPSLPTPPANPDFVWKWKSAKPVIKRVYSNSGKEVPPEES